MKVLLIVLASVIVVVVLILALALGFGGPGQPAPMASIGEPFRSVDWSTLPPVQTWRARDGAALAFRRYAAAPPKGSAVLVHGSSASGASMHVLAQAMAAAGLETFTLDMRGHGASGIRGHIDYVGQLEDDLEDFVKSRELPRPSTLVGLSAGGGFTLRVAGSPRQDLFSSYLLLSPYLRYDAPTFRKSGPEWARVGIPRFMSLMALNGLGIHAFDGLVVTRFATRPEDEARLTPFYDFRLARNFQPHDDYAADIRGARHPMALVVGTGDELFVAEQFAQVFQAAGKPVPVTLVPGVGHVSVILAPEAVKAAVAAVQGMQDGK